MEMVRRARKLIGLAPAPTAEVCATSTTPLSTLLRDGPTPLAEIARRAANSQTAKAMAQNAAHYLAEAGAALAAAYWFSRVRIAHRDLPEAIRRPLRGIRERGASLGTWIELLRVAAEVASEESLLDAPLPTATSREYWQQLAAAVNGLVQSPDNPFGARAKGVLDQLDRACEGSVLDAFAFCATLRNLEAHTWMIPEAASKRIAPHLLQAVCSLLLSPGLLGGTWVGRPQQDLFDENRWHWVALRGLAPAALPPGDPSAPDPRKDRPGRLHFVSPQAALSVPFFVLEEIDATGLARFGFLSRINRRSVEYVSYVAGGAFKNEARADEVRAFFDAISGPFTAEHDSESDIESDRQASGRRYGDFLIEGNSGDLLGAGRCAKIPNNPRARTAKCPLTWRPSS